MPINTPRDDGAEILQTHNFTAGPKTLHSKKTPYGKFVDNTEARTRSMFGEAKEKYPQAEYGDDENVEGQYALAYRKALDDARTKKDYEGLMRIIIEYVNTGPAEVKNMVFDEIPTPNEAEKIFFEMGKKQYPELANAGFTEVCELWKQVGLMEVPKEFVAPKNANDVLPSLRNHIWSMMVMSQDMLTASTGKLGVKLVYAMMVLERRLSGGNIDMTVRERMAVDVERAKLNE